MLKIFSSILLSSTIAFAGVINAIALTVNEDPITLYDIEKTMQVNNIDKNQAVSLLIDKLLYEQLVKQNNVTVDIFDVNNYIEKLAQTNGMDLYAFKSIIKQKYKDYSIFEEEAKKVVTRQKLIEKVVKGQLKIASEEDLKLYYENNKNKFLAAKNVEVIQYTSKKKNSLVSVIQSPLVVSEDVEKSPLMLEVSEINPQLQYLINNTKENNFTPIFTANKFYNSLFILKKEGSTVLDFETVKSKVFNEVMSLREKKFLKDYFEKQKLTADIKLVR